MTRHFLDIAGHQADDLRSILENAKSIKAVRQQVAKDRPLDGKILAMIFDKPSTRTRVSFDVGMRQLGGETIVMDGSSSPFVFLIECAGVVEQNAPKRAIRILKEVRDDEETRSGILSPAEGFSVSFEIDFDTQAIGHQELFMEVRPDQYKQEVSRARTFGFLHEADQLRKMGLARGGSLDNAIVIDGDTIMNEGGLRYGNEFVRHKILDSIGDLFLAGAPIIGHYHGIKSGHAQTYRLVKQLLSDNSAWEWATLPTNESNIPVNSSYVAPERAVAALV